MSRTRAALGALSIAAVAAVGGTFTAPAGSVQADPNLDGVIFLHFSPGSGSDVGQPEHLRRARVGDEQKYLADVHRVAPGLAKSDSQLIADGWKACSYRRSGHENIDLPGVSGPEAAWALTDLCPEVGDF